MKYTKLIKEILTQELARIPQLFHLSSTDDTDLDSKIPAEIRNKSVVKNIIQFYKDNNNQPSLRQDIIDYYGYPDTATIGSLFKALQNAGVVVSAGLARPKAIAPPKTGVQGRHITPVDQRDDKSKIVHIYEKLKRNQEPNEIYKLWFLEKYGEDKYQEFKGLIDAYKGTARDKDAARDVKSKIRNFLVGLGIQFKKKGRTPGTSKYNKPVRTPNPETGMDDVTYDDEVDENERQPVLPPRRRELPGIAEPPTRTAPTPDRKRRTLTPPDPDAKPAPKNESDKVKKKNIDFTKPVASSAKDYADKNKNEGKVGWDPKKGLVQKDKEPVKGINKPKEKPKTESIVDKVINRYKSLKK